MPHFTEAEHVPECSYARRLTGTDGALDDPVLSCYMYRKLFCLSIFFPINRSCLVESGFYCPSLKNETSKCFQENPGRGHACYMSIE